MTTSLVREIELPGELPHQSEVLSHPARMKVVVCGRRWGKTALGLMATVDGHGPRDSDGSPAWKGAASGGKIWWVAPDYPTASEIWRDLKRAVRNATVEKSEVERRVELYGGGSVTVRSAHEPDKLVATGLDGVVIDEAGKVPGEAWDFLRPTLADRQGWAIFIGTPRGYNHFFDLFENVPGNTGWARWQRPSRDNPMITLEELGKAKRDAPRLYGQEWEARFECPEGAEWPPEYFGRDLWFDDWPRTPWIAKAIALDPSKGKDRHKLKEGRPADYSAFVWGATDGKTIYIDANLDNVRDASRIVQDGIGIFRGFPGCNAFVVEINQFQELLGGQFLQEAERLRIPHLPLYGYNNTANKELRIRTIGPFLAQKELRFRATPGCQLLVQQLRDFPAGQHDDGPDALEMLLRILCWLVAGGSEDTQSPKLLRA